MARTQVAGFYSGMIEINNTWLLFFLFVIAQVIMCESQFYIQVSKFPDPGDLIYFHFTVLTIFGHLMFQGFGRDLKEFVGLLDAGNARRVETEKFHRAATLIQSVYRSFKTRKSLQKASVGFTKLQRSFRLWIKPFCHSDRSFKHIYKAHVEWLKVQVHTLNHKCQK